MARSRRNGTLIKEPTSVVRRKQAPRTNAWRATRCTNQRNVLYLGNLVIPVMGEITLQCARNTTKELVCQHAAAYRLEFWYDGRECLIHLGMTGLDCKLTARGERHVAEGGYGAARQSLFLICLQQRADQVTSKSEQLRCAPIQRKVLKQIGVTHE